MTDHTIANVEGQAGVNQQAGVSEPALGAEIRPLRLRVARYVSNILAPASISLPLVLVVALYRAPDPRMALVYACITLLFLSLGPLAYIVIGVRLGKLSDVDVSRRSERAGPFLFGLASVMLGLLTLSAMHGPKTLTTLLILTAVSGVIMMFITLWWKISIHASSMAGAATILTVLFGSSMIPTFLLLILVSWSRVVLRRHTIAQVTAGALMSIALTIIIIKLLGI